MQHFRQPWGMLLIGLFVGAPGLHAAEPSRESATFFEKEVRPPPDCPVSKMPWREEARIGAAPSDSRTALLKGGDNGPAIVPGKTNAGTFLAAVNHTGELKMPPSGKLTAPQLAIFTKWIADGAVSPEDQPKITQSTNTQNHWAFQPVRKPALPTVANPEWMKNEIDRFILASLESRKLKPAGDAERRTLIRRVTLNLTGLPPTPEEIQRFLNDSSPDAYVQLVERLLASPAYGERWGRHWLDVARYADTAGDGSDYPVREAGKYRDWVIRALNADQPIDEFIREQIAGDILAKKGPAERYADRVTATGFLAIGKRYGYAPNTDYQHLDFADAIDSVGRSILGLSIGCARCHDHKYDPISSADYYAMYGIFQSTKWAFPGGEEHKRPVNFPALIPPEDAARLEKVKAAELARLDGESDRLKKERLALLGKSFAGGIDLGLEGQPLGKPPAGVWLSSGPNSVIAEAQSPFRHIHPAGTRGVRIGTALQTDGVRYVFPAAYRKTPGKQIHFSIDFRSVPVGDKTGSYRFYWGRGVIASLALECSVSATEFHLKDGAKWELARAIKPNEWNTLQIVIDPEKKTFSGSVGKPGDMTVFQNKLLNPAWDGILDTFICDGMGHVAGKIPEHDLDNLAIGESPFAAPGGPEVKVVPQVPEQSQKIAAIDAQLATLKKQRDTEAARDLFPVAYGVSEGAPTNAKIQKRGEPDKFGAEVPRRFLSVLGGDAIPEPTAGSGRLELANWLTRSSNPLTARVFVNRVWQWHFGQGLVPTASDFGVRGETPSHPELLDWLAAKFMESGWSLKGLHRLILLSKTYRLSSEDMAENLKVDPNNRWHWRHSRQALDAESIRDSMLFVSGKLDRTPPTPHPFPPVESWGFSIHNPFYAVYDNSRRSVYLMVQRNRRHPYLALFDAADPNQSAAERTSTTTPTQTLYLMNSPFIHAQSEALASRLMALSGDDRQRIQQAIEATHAHAATDAETSQGLDFLTMYRQKLTERKIPADKQAVLAWSAYARVLLTSNAFLYVD